MRHNHSLHGFGIRLRPVEITDAAFILQIRTMPHVLGWVGDTKASLQDQERWLCSYFERAGDYYFIIEQGDGTKIGTIGLYDFHDHSAEWGRWILLPGALAAVQSALLIHRFAFEMLHLDSLRGTVVSTNTAVLSFHRRFGARECGVQPKARQINGQAVDLVNILLERDRWPDVVRRMVPLAEREGKSLMAHA